MDLILKKAQEKLADQERENLIIKAGLCPTCGGELDDDGGEWTIDLVCWPCGSVVKPKPLFFGMIQLPPQRVPKVWRIY